MCVCVRTLCLILGNILSCNFKMHFQIENDSRKFRFWADECIYLFLVAMCSIMVCSISETSREKTVHLLAAGECALPTRPGLLLKHLLVWIIHIKQGE